MAIYFLDVDDEVTSAAARIRDSSDNRIALVLAGGSRVATSRINFRLLAREARQRHKRLAIIDLATLTGAVTMALGDKIAGLIAGNAGQNKPSASVGLTALPYDPFTRLLLDDKTIRVISGTALPDESSKRPW